MVVECCLACGRPWVRALALQEAKEQELLSGWGWISGRKEEGKREGREKGKREREEGTGKGKDGGEKEGEQKILSGWPLTEEKRHRNQINICKW